MASKKDGRLKTREPRKKVLIRVRMHAGASWGEACILNISSRGLLMQAGTPPARGTYLELRRGRHAIIGRVVWASNHRFGVRSQDSLPVEGIINEPDCAAAELQPPTGNGAVAERRSSPRNHQFKFENSRMLARAMDFICIAIFVASAAGLVFRTLDQTLARPLTEVTAALTPG